MPASTQELVAQAQAGNAAAVEQLLTRHYGQLRAFLRLRIDPALRAKESSADLAQSVCRDVLAGLARFEYRGDGSFKAWLFKAALNKLREKHEFYHAHKRDVRQEVSLGTPTDPGDLLLSAGYATLSPSRIAAGREQIALLEAAFDALPEDYREVLTLSRLAGLSHAEIAQQMARTVEASRVLLSRALARLASLLQQSEA